MKDQIQIVKPALGGPQSTTLEARLAKIQDGRLWAYGGTFCISTPIASTLECGFHPQIVEEFFSIPRPEFKLTEHGDFLILSCGEKDARKTRKFDARTIQSLIALGRKYPIEKPLEHLNTIATTCRNNTQCFRQGAWFKDRMIFAMKGSSVCLSVDGFQFDHPQMGIPADSMQALARMKGEIVSVSFDQLSLQFDFEDGTSLTTRLLEGLSCPNFMAAFEGYSDVQKFSRLGFSPEVVTEVMSLKLKSQTELTEEDMVWHGENGTLSFTAPNDNTGSFQNAFTGVGSFHIHGEAFRTLLGMEPGLIGLMRRSVEEPFHSMNGYGDNFAVAAALSRE